MFEQLHDSLVWLVFIYSDNSVKFVYTTLNAQLLRENNVVLMRDAVYDFARNKYLSFVEVKEILIKEDNLSYGEVNNFANNFIRK